MRKSKIKKSLVILIGCVSFLLFCEVFLFAETKDALKGMDTFFDDLKSVNIKADKLEYQTRKNLIIFSGNSIARQDGASLRAKTLRLILKNGRIVELYAEGNVVFARDKWLAKSQKLQYKQSANTLILQGKPKFSYGKNVIAGKLITLDLSKKTIAVKKASASFNFKNK